MPDTILDASDIEQFISRGYVRVRGCFSRELARDLTSRACERLYCSLDDPSTWPSGRMRPPESQRVSFESIAPRAWQAACELIGGADRALQCTWGDGFIINFGGQEELANGWVPPSAKPQPPWAIWHKDGDFFRHFLDSPEQGLLVIGTFSDIEHQGGATFIACDSVGRVARYLAARPEGVLPNELLHSVKAMVDECSDFVETTGEIGDVYLLHPFMAHSHSQNASRRARFIVNPPIKLAEPMNFARERPEDHSPVERAVLRALGVERYEFTPAGPREAVVPERLAREKQIWEERERLARQAQM
jgi:hypothetical protein